MPESSSARLLFALHQINHARWIGALVRTDGEIAIHQLRPAHMGNEVPPDITPALSTVPVGEAPIELLLVLQAGAHIDAELFTVELQQACLETARIMGVNVVSMPTVLTSLGLAAGLDVTTLAGHAALIAAVNAAVGGTFGSDDCDSARAVALALAGMDGPWALPRVLEMRPAPRASLPSQSRAMTRADTVDRVGIGVRPSAVSLVEASTERPQPRVAAASDSSKPRRSRAASPATPSAPPGLLSVREVARMLGVSVPTVRRLIRCGELHAGKVGCQIRVPIASLDHFRQDCKLGAPTPPKLVGLPAPTDVEDEEATGQRLADRLGLR